MQTCWFCELRPGRPESNQEIRLHNRVGSSSAGLPHASVHKVVYKTARVKIPRCQQCKDILARHGILRGVAIAVMAIAALTAGGFLAEISNTVVGIVSGVLVMFVTAFILYPLVETINPGKRALVNDDYKQFPGLKKMLESGWVIGEKPSV